MEPAQAILIVLIIAIIVYVAVQANRKKASFDGGNGGKITAVDNSGGLDVRKSDSLREWQHQHLKDRTSVRNDTAGYGAQRQMNPVDEEMRQRNGQFMSPKRLAEAEKSAWTSYNPNASSHYDVTQGTYPGTDLTQQLGAAQEGDWAEKIGDLAVDSRTRAQHAQWVNEVGPHAQGAMTVDNMDEAVAMSAGPPRVGITAFRHNAVSQGPCTLQITEADAKLQSDHFKPMHW